MRISDWSSDVCSSDLGGLTLADRLNREVTSDRYQRLDPLDGLNGIKSRRVEVISRIIGQYRDRAFRQHLLREKGFDTLAADYATERRNLKSVPRRGAGALQELIGQ